jgi:hypothetical protein
VEVAQHPLPQPTLPLQVPGANLLHRAARQVVVEGRAPAAAAERVAAAGAGDGGGGGGETGVDHVLGAAGAHHMTLALVEVQQKYNNPKAYTISWAKNQKKEVVDIVKMLIYEGGSKIGLNLSVQSMDEHTLEVIKRKNLDTNKIEEVFDMCEENNIPLYTELILGLPGETMESWKENFYRLYKAGNHTGITIYQAQLLENAEMNLTQREKYQLTGQIVYDYLVGTYNEHEVREGIEVVTSTIDLPFEKMNEAQVFSWFQNTFHINGITNYISRVLHKKYNIEYTEKTVRYTHRVCFDDDKIYSFFAVTWRPKGTPAYWLNFKLITDRNNRQ